VNLPVHRFKKIRKDHESGKKIPFTQSNRRKKKKRKKTKSKSISMPAGIRKKLLKKRKQGAFFIKIK